MKTLAMIATVIALSVTACASAGPTPTSMAITTTTTDEAVSASPDSNDEAAFLLVLKAGLQGIPVPPATDTQLIGFGYEICNRLEAAVNGGSSPQEEAQREVADAVRPDGMIDGGKGDSLIVRSLFQKSASAILCPDEDLIAWAEEFDNAVVLEVAGLIDG